MIVFCPSVDEIVGVSGVFCYSARPIFDLYRKKYYLRAGLTGAVPGRDQVAASIRQRDDAALLLRP